MNSPLPNYSFLQNLLSWVNGPCIHLPPHYEPAHFFNTHSDSNQHCHISNISHHHQPICFYLLFHTICCSLQDHTQTVSQITMFRVPFTYSIEVWEALLMRVGENVKTEGKSLRTEQMGRGLNYMLGWKTGNSKRMNVALHACSH